MEEHKADQPVVQPSSPAPEDARDSLQCLIIVYGDTHIDTLAQLLNLTSYAETMFSSLCMQRRLR